MDVLSVLELDPAWMRNTFPDRKKFVNVSPIVNASR
jgi:hypothetical protein